MVVDRRTALTALTGALLLPVAGCATPALAGQRDLRFMVPQLPGGGYDVTARTAAVVLEESGLTRGIDTFNLAGAGGTVALARLVAERGNAELLLMAGLGVVGGTRAEQSEVSLTDATPVARLIAEPSVVLVRPDSRFRTWSEFLSAWTGEPSAVAVGGGSWLGGPDHLLPLHLAGAVGIAPKDVDYQSFRGGGELLPALLDGSVEVAFSGVSEFRDLITDGVVTALASTASGELPGVPTLTELGVDLEFSSWRGVVAPPGISEQRRAELVQAFSDLAAEPAWRTALRERGWQDALLTGAEFSEFLRSEESRVSGVLAGLGLG